MAGYFTYSISWEKFKQFVESPTNAQLSTFAKALDDHFEDYLEDGHSDADPMPIAERWSLDGEDAENAIREHLRKHDWYANIDQYSQRIWSESIQRLCESFNLRAESDGIYWNLIEIAKRELGDKSDKHVVARFGRCPYSVDSIEKHEPVNFGEAWWDPYHSLHPPDEVARLVDELQSIRDAIMNSGDTQAMSDFEELMPALIKITKKNRMLYVTVDT